MTGENPWRSILEGAPPRNVVLEVCGDSGMITNRVFLALAYHDANYRPLDPWRDIQGSALSDQGWIPTFWRYPSEFPAELLRK